MNDAAARQRARWKDDFRTTWWPLTCYIGTLFVVVFGPYDLLTNYLMVGAGWGITFPVRHWIRESKNGPIFDGIGDFILKIVMGALEVVTWIVAVPFGILFFRNLEG